MGTSDYAQVLFACGYYMLIGIVILNVIIERNYIWEQLKKLKPEKKTENLTDEDQTLNKKLLESE